MAREAVTYKVDVSPQAAFDELVQFIEKWVERNVDGATVRPYVAPELRPAGDRASKRS